MAASKRLSGSSTKAKRAMLGKQFGHVCNLLGADGMLAFVKEQLRRQARRDLRARRDAAFDTGMLGSSWWVHAARAKARGEAP